MTAKGATGVELNRLIERVVKDFVASSTENAMRSAAGEKIWAEPLVGFSRGDDALYRRLQEDIGPFYWTPQEAFAQVFPATVVDAAELSVATWVLPQTLQSRHDNRRQRKYPAERWSRARLYGEQFNDLLREHLVAQLQAEGIAAVAPVLAPSWKWMTSERYGFASRWSERHTAYVSGLGTFGLCEGLITPVGKAVRLGSVVLRGQVQLTPRPYDGIHDWCLFYAGGAGACERCSERCPAEAVSAQGHDKNKCAAYLQKVTLPYSKAHYDVEIASCGLCQTAVPCEAGIPVPRR